MMGKMSAAKIVVIGGGTGSFTVLSGLKKKFSDITAIVNMADDGGSTGQLRDELGVLPPGDVRQCLVALSESPKLRELFTYRFEEGALKGHAFGNIFLTALEKMTGSFADAIDVADEVLQVNGRVVPVTLDNVRLIMRQRKGHDIIGEYKIGNMPFTLGEQRPILELSPPARLNPEAKRAIQAADMIVIAPGNLYGSVAPALLVKGMTRALQETKATIVYVCNLVTKPGQTDGFFVHDFADEIERFIGARVLDFVLYNTQEPETSLRAKYIKDNEYNVAYDEQILAQSHFTALGSAFLSGEAVQHSKADTIATSRSYIRHNTNAITQHLIAILERQKSNFDNKNAQE